MPVPSLLTDLSTTAASNSPSGSDNVFPDLDNYIRALSAFVASVATNSATNGFTQPYLPAANPTYTGTLTGGTGVVNLGAGQFYKDASGNVGIGTTAPAVRLESSTTSAGATVEVLRLSNPGLGANTQAQLKFFAGSTNYGTISGGYGAFAPQMTFNLPGSGNYVWQVSSAESMRVDTAGRLLIGRTNQNATAPKLSVEGRIDSVTTGSYASTFGSSSSAPFVVSESSTGSEVERMRLDASGNLGVGVTPSAWLSGVKALQLGTGGSIDTRGTNNFEVGSNCYMDSGVVWRYINTTTATQYVQDSGTHRWLNAPSGTAGNAITFTQAMTLDASGNLLVGTTTSALSNSNSHIIALGQHYLQHASTAVSGTIYTSFVFNAVSIGSITQSGTTAVLYNTTSDKRLKTNIQDAPDASALIDSIQVRSFDWLADGSHQRYGMVAQELHAVAPEAVHAPADPEAMMAVDYSKLVPMLIKEVQSLRARVAALEAA